MVRSSGATANTTALLLATLLTTTALMPGAALAQTADDDDQVNSADIVVTARKREEDAQSVPIAITAYSAEGLAERNISNFADLGNATPGLNVTSIAGGTTQQIFVRGLAPANTTTDLNVEANVGTFIDGIYQTSRNTLDMIAVLDVGQIEVAKGPQSALFGRSTFAGALSIRTQRPTRDFSGSFSATVGEDKDYRARGSLSVPVGETLAVRVGAGYLTYDGWGANSAAKDNLGGTEKYAVNAAILWEPSSDFSALLSGFITHSETEMSPVSHVPLAAYNCGTTSTAAVTLNLRQLYCGPLEARKVSSISPGIPETKAKTRQIALELDGTLNGVKIVSVTGYTEAENRAHNDFDGTAAGVLLGVCSAANCFPAGLYTRQARANFVSISVEKVRTFSQELRLQSDNDGPFQWLLGGNFFDQRIPLAAGGIGVDRAGLAANERFVQLTQVGTVPATGVGAYEFTANPFITADSNAVQVASSWARASTKTMSIFAALGYQFGDIRFNAEGRYNIDRKRAQVFSVNNPLAVPGVNQPIVGTQTPAAGQFPVIGPQFARTFTSFTPRFTLDYRVTPDVLLYASVAKGVRAGGFNTANAVSATGILASEVPYEEETNWTYELGIKSEWFDRRVLFNAAYFHVDWSDAQVSSFTENPTAVNPVRIIRNIGAIKSDGFEVQVEVKPIDMLGIGGSLVWSDVKFGRGVYDGGSVTQCVIGTGAAATAAAGCPPVTLVTLPSGQVRAVPSLEGLRPARSVKLQWNLHATADIPLGNDWDLSARVDVNHTGPSWANIINSFSFGERTLTNVRLGVSNDRYSLSLWANNLFDKVYAQNAISQPRAGLPFAFIIPEVYLGEGRRIGVTGSVKF